jgi:hypothetical protein
MSKSSPAMSISSDEGMIPKVNFEGLAEAQAKTMKKHSKAIERILRFSI